jgi:hypothetical protein
LRLGRPPLPHNGSHLAGAARIDEDERFAAEAVEILLHHAADEQRRDAGIEGVAAPRQNLERGRGGQRMAGRYAAIAAHDGRPLGGAGGDLCQRRERRQHKKGDDTKNCAAKWTLK